MSAKNNMQVPSFIPTSKTGIYDVDLLHDIMVLSRIPLRVENIEPMFSLIRMIKGKIVSRILTLETISKHSGYPVDRRLLTSLNELKMSFEKQEKSLRNYVKGLLERQKLLHVMLMRATKKRIEKSFEMTKSRIEGMRKHLVSANLRKTFLKAIVQKRLAGMANATSSQSQV